MITMNDNSFIFSLNMYCFIFSHHFNKIYFCDNRACNQLNHLDFSLQIFIYSSFCNYFNSFNLILSTNSDFLKIHYYFSFVFFVSKFFTFSTIFHFVYNFSGFPLLFTTRLKSNYNNGSKCFVRNFSK